MDALALLWSGFILFCIVYTIVRGRRDLIERAEVRRRIRANLTRGYADDDGRTDDGTDASAYFHSYRDRRTVSGSDGHADSDGRTDRPGNCDSGRGTIYGPDHGFSAGVAAAGRTGGRSDAAALDAGD